MGRSTFRSKDRVIYISGRHEESRANPLWGGKQGYVVGSIVKIGSSGTMEVRWDNGTHNNYLLCDLELYTWTTALKRFYKKSRARLHIRVPGPSWTKYIGIVALVLVLDYFLLDCKCIRKCRTVVEGAIDKVTSKIQGPIE